MSYVRGLYLGEQNPKNGKWSWTLKRKIPTDMIRADMVKNPAYYCGLEPGYYALRTNHPVRSLTISGSYGIKVAEIKKFYAKRPSEPDIFWLYDGKVSTKQPPIEVYQASLESILSDPTI